MSKVLITYVTKQGSTKEVAETIAKHMQAYELETQVKSIDAVASVEPYDLVVIGAPINGMRLMQDAIDFVGIHQSELLYKKVAYFSLSYTVKHGRRFWKKRIQNAFSDMNRQVPPLMTAAFAGKVDDVLPGLVRFLFGVSKDVPNDQREWSEIENWSISLVEAFKKAIE